MTFSIRILSQVKTIFEGEIKSLVCPTASGMVEILPNHTDMISMAELGEAVITTAEDKKVRILLNGGILHIENGAVTMLSDEISVPEELIKEEIEEAVESAKKQIAAKTDPAVLIQLEKQLRFELFKKKYFGGA